MSQERHAPTPTALARALAHGDRLALSASEGHIRYQELLGIAEAVAARLLNGRSDLEESRVAFLVPPGIRWTAIAWAVWRAGGIAVPLALSHPAREHAWVLDDASPEVVVTDTTLAERVSAEAGARGIPLLSVEELVPTIERGQHRPQSSFPVLAPSRRALILYTSGTTGRPKGVVTTHAGLEAQIKTLIEAWGWRVDDHAVLVLPLHHVHGIVNVLGCALWAGARCTVLPGFKAEETWDRIAENDLTVFMAVPSIYQRLLETWDAAPERTRQRWSSGAHRLRLTVSGSAALPVSVLERWERLSGQRLLERYGMTEIGMALSNPLRGPGDRGTSGGRWQGFRSASWTSMGSRWVAG